MLVALDDRRERVGPELELAHHRERARARVEPLDHAPRERVLGELLIALGEDEEAWRYLSTPIDLAPREGASFQVAAEVLQRQGKLDQALGLWWRAYAIDATNPTWLQRAAQVELALGQKDKAKATLTKIARGAWHQRWSGVKYWAENALRQERN
ncbi:MAG: tetratricopeptide repeat protein [Deltaproteobacteria bacterium]|nr:tetratricopeptide repeat protein [Kofleriaceae bacterium]